MFLNLAWDTVFGLLLDLADAEECNSDEWDTVIYDAEQTDNYWKAAKGPLSIAHALVQQGAELTLKATIASVSPFLLVSVPPSGWPRGCDHEDKSFAEFRTIDAQDLVRACNTVRSSALPEQFVSTFDKFRNQRNALFHTVDNRLEFSVKKIIRYILGIAQLIAPGQWPGIRKEYLEGMPACKVFDEMTIENQLCREMDIMIDLLEKRELIDWFSFNKSNRRYICPCCYECLDHECDPPYPRTAQLKPNNGKSTNLHCFVCDKDMDVTRRACQEEGCKGNVISTTHDLECLTCFELQGEIE